MKLCFGTFAKTLKYSIGRTITQDKLVALLANCLDSGSGYIIEREVSDNGNIKDIAGDKHAISNLVNCKFNYRLHSSVEIPTRRTVIDYLKANVIPLMNEKCKIKILLSLLRLIENDESIDGEEKEIFISIFGSDKRKFFKHIEFVFSDVLAKTFLYVTNREVKNIKGQDDIKMFTQGYVEESMGAFTYEYEWRSDEETLELYCYETLHCFNLVAKDYMIETLLFHEDFTGSYNWIGWNDMIDGFHSDIKSVIMERYNNKSKLVLKIKEFDDTLKDLISFIYKKYEKSDHLEQYLVPKYTNKEEKEDISKTVLKFNKRLKQIYTDIRTHLFKDYDIVI